MKSTKKVIALLLCLTMVFSLFTVMPAAAEGSSAAKVYDIRVDDLVAPVGIDNTNPVFSWKMESDAIGAAQTAYSIVVASETGDEMWNTGWVEGDKSVGIVYDGQALQSSTEYQVSIALKDQDGNVTEAAGSTFEMGLLEADAWDDTEWISLGNNLSTATSYTIDFDFLINQDNQGLCFGMQDTGTFVMWQVNTYDGSNNNAGGDVVLLRPHFKKNGTWIGYPGLAGSTVKAVDVSAAIGYKASTLEGNLVHERIVVDGKNIKTYFGPDADNMTLADDYTYTENVPLGKIGFRQSNSSGGAHEISSFDNIVVKDAAGEILYENDFSDTSDYGFSTTNGVMSFENGMLKVGNPNPVSEQIYIQSEGGSSLPAYRKSFTPKADLVSAKLYTSGLGVYESYINGERVGRLMDDGSISYDELKPGFTEMGVRKFYNTYDVTYMLDKDAENVLSAVVTSGWWSGGVARNYGKTTAYFAKMILTYSDGSQEIINTDGSWKAAKASAVQMADIFQGETYDARIDQSWMLPGFDDSAWANVSINNEYNGKISAWSGSPIAVREDLQRDAQSLTVYQGATGAAAGYHGTINVLNTYADGDTVTLNPGETLLVDFGQNFAGWEAFEVEGEAGTALTIQHGEILNDGNGATSRGNDGPEGSIYNANYRSAAATTKYILSGNGIESYHPSFTFYGFHYIEITTTKTVTFHSVDGQVVTSSEKDTGTMETADKDVNQLISNIRWGMISNYLSVPTDCPQRDERQGWTADTQNFSEAGCYMGFSKSFLMKFMEDMRDCQRSDGAYPGIAPTGNYSGASWGALGWADAGVIVPYNLYVMYGDTTVITENWESMKKFMDVYMVSTNKWGGNHSYGDWLAYESNDDTIKNMIGVAYYAWDAMLMSKMADAIGLADEAARYMAVYEDEKAFFQEQFVNADGTLKRGEQSVCLHALYLDLLPNEESVAAVTEQLISNIERNGNRLQTGFLGTEIIMHTLTKIGRSDVAYKLLLQHENPSWLYSVDQGATTIWERWNSYTKATGFGDVGMNSFNHYSYGSVASWMFRSMAGISYDEENPGFKHIVLAPNPDQFLKTVKASYDSAYGTIVSNSVIDGDTWTYDAVIPANTTATVKLPIENIDTLTVNGKALDALTLEADGIVYNGYENGIALFDAVAGSFSFASNVTVYNFVTIKSGDVGADVPPTSVSVNGGAAQSLPATLKVSAGDVITASATVLNDVDYAIDNWTNDAGEVVSEGANLSYVAGNSDATITMNIKWVGYDNIAIGAAVTANAVNGDWAAANLTDGKLSYLGGTNGWSSTSKGKNNTFAEESAIIDLGEEKEFNRFHIYPRNLPSQKAEFTDLMNCPTAYTFYISNDKTNWTPVYSTSNGPVTNGFAPIVVELDEAVSARYVKFGCTAVNGPDENGTCYVQLSELGIYNVKETPIEPETSVKAVDAQGEVLTEATVGQLFDVVAVTPDDVAKVALFNEYGLKVGLKEITRTDNGDGTATWTFKTSIGTVGAGRILSLATIDADGVYTMTDASFTIDIAAVKPAVISASIEETAVVNEPVTLTVVTNTAVSKINIYNEFGMKMGTLSQSYQDVDGSRVWIVQTKIGTKGTRTFTVSGKSKYGEISGTVTTNEVVVTK